MNSQQFSINRILNILVIEDEEADRELLSLFLESSGLNCRVTYTDNGEDTRRLLTETAFDAVLSDHRLPAFSSSEALRIVSAMRRPPPLIVVSGHIGETAAVQLLHDGAADVVPKDRLGRLGPAIARALSETELRDASNEAQGALRDSETGFVP